MASCLSKLDITCVFGLCLLKTPAFEVFQVLCGSFLSWITSCPEQQRVGGHDCELCGQCFRGNIYFYSFLFAILGSQSFLLTSFTCTHTHTTEPKVLVAVCLVLV